MAELMPAAKIPTRGRGEGGGKRFGFNATCIESRKDNKGKH